MPRLNYKNNSFSTLSSTITNSATSFNVANGADLPDVPFRATILSEVGNNAIEIIEVRAKSGNTLSSILRGQEGTTAVAHNAGVRIENRFTVQGLNELSTEVVTTLPGTPYSGQIVFLEVV